MKMMSKLNQWKTEDIILRFFWFCLLRHIYATVFLFLTLAGFLSLPRHEQNIHEVKIMEGFWHKAQSEWDLDLNFNLEQCNLSGLQLFWAQSDQSSREEAEVCQYQEATYWASVSSTSLYLLHIVPGNVQHKSSIWVIHLTRRSCLTVLNDCNPVAFTSSVTDMFGKTISKSCGLSGKLRMALWQSWNSNPDNQRHVQGCTRCSFPSDGCTAFILFYKGYTEFEWPSDALTMVDCSVCTCHADHGLPPGTDTVRTGVTPVRTWLESVEFIITS